MASSPDVQQPDGTLTYALAAALLARADKLSSSGQLRKAEADYARACELLRKAAAEGAPLGSSSSALPSLPKALTSLGLLLTLRGDSAGAERALVEAIDTATAEGSPWPARWAEPPSEWPILTVDVALYNLIAVYALLQYRAFRGAVDKRYLRMQQWGAQLQRRGAAEAEGGGEPTAEYFSGLLAAATLGLVTDGEPLRFGSDQILSRLRHRLEDAAGCEEALSQAQAFLLQLSYADKCESGGTPDAVEQELAPKLVTAAPSSASDGATVPSAAWPSGDPAGSLHWRFQHVQALQTIFLRYTAIIHDGGVPGKPPHVLKNAALSCLANAARCVAEGGREWLESETYTEIVGWVLGHASPAIPDAESLDDAAFPLADGCVIRLREPNGAGQIALAEEHLRVSEKLYGARSALLVGPLHLAGAVLLSFRDLVGARAALERLIGLCAEVMGPRHATTRSARTTLEECDIFCQLAKRAAAARGGGRGSSGRDLGGTIPWEAFVAVLGGRAGVMAYAQRMFPLVNSTDGVQAKDPTQSGVENDSPYREQERRAAAADKELLRATAAAQQHDRLCLACGERLVKVKKCGLCGAADYCSKRCQLAHWGAHKAVCMPPQEGGRADRSQPQTRGQPETSSAAAERSEGRGGVAENGKTPAPASTASAAPSPAPGGQGSGDPLLSAAAALDKASVSGAQPAAAGGLAGSAMVAAAAEEEQPQQAASSCAGCGALASSEEVKLSRCSRCLAVAYCGKACQAAHWKQHKGACNAHAG